MMQAIIHLPHPGTGPITRAMDARTRWSILLIILIAGAGLLWFRHPNGHVLAYDYAIILPWCGDDAHPQVPIRFNDHQTVATIATGNAGGMRIPRHLLTTMPPAGGRADGPPGTGITGKIACILGPVLEFIPATRVVDTESASLGYGWLVHKGAVIDCGRRIVAWDALEDGLSALDNLMCRDLFDHGFVKISSLSREFSLMLVTVTIANTHNPSDVVQTSWSFLVDTGSPQSIIDRVAARRLASIDTTVPTVTVSPVPGNGGAERSMDPGRTLPVRLSCGGMDHEGTLLVADLDGLNQTIAERIDAGKRKDLPHVDGILGMDILLAKQAVIDPKSSALYLRR